MVLMPDNRRAISVQPQPQILNILFVGGGRGCYDILHLLSNYALQNITPNIIGVADPDVHARGRMFATELGIPTNSDFHSFLNERDLDLIIELTGSEKVLEELHEVKREGVKVLDHLGALFLWEIIAIQQRSLELEKKVRDLDTMATVGEMAYRLTHELRNPLMIFGSLVRRIMTRTDLGHGVRKRLKHASDLVRRMEFVISDICDVVHPLNPKFSMVNMTEFLEWWCKDVSTEARLVGVKIDSTIASDLPTILVDPSLLRQALWHIIENSFDSMAETGGVIQVEAELCWDDILIVCRDTGPGLIDIQPGRVMNPFSSTKDGRMGLGLALCRQIILRHGGKVEIRKREEKGTKVIISLPITFYRDDK